jgi:nicotinamide-nucleotide amidase
MRPSTPPGFEPGGDGYPAVLGPATPGRAMADDVGAELAELAPRSGRTIAVAESLTGGALSAAVAKAPGSSDWFRGGIVAYARGVKHDLLDVPDGPVVSEAAVRAMAVAVGRLLGADLTVAVSGVAGPGEQDGQPPGTVWLAISDAGVVTTRLDHLRGRPEEIVAETVRRAVAWLAETCRADVAVP